MEGENSEPLIDAPPPAEGMEMEAPADADIDAPPPAEGMEMEAVADADIDAPPPAEGMEMEVPADIDAPPADYMGMEPDGDDYQAMEMEEAPPPLLRR